MRYSIHNRIRKGKSVSLEYEYKHCIHPKVRTTWEGVVNARPYASTGSQTTGQGELAGILSGGKNLGGDLHE